MRNFNTRSPPDGGYPIDSDLQHMTDDGCPHSPDPERWSDPDWRDNLGEWDTFEGERLMYPVVCGTVAGAILSSGHANTPTEVAGILVPSEGRFSGRAMIGRWLFAAVVAAGVVSVAGAQPPHVALLQLPAGSPVDGQWFFRGDPSQPCYVQTVLGPRGPMLIFTNEKGSQAGGWISRDGRRVTIPDWNLTGTVRTDVLVWPNGDFWGR